MMIASLRNSIGSGYNNNNNISISSSNSSIANYLSTSQFTGSPSINEVSKRIKRDEPIEQYLLNIGKKYEEKKERLKEAYLEEESKLAKFTPEISPSAKQLHREGELLERFMKIEEQKKARLDIQRSEYEEKSKAELVFSPTISARSKQLTARSDVVGINQTWASEREERLQKQRQDALEAEAKQLRKAPELSSRTIKLANKIKEKQQQQIIATATSPLRRSQSPTTSTAGASAEKSAASMSIEEYLVSVDRQRKQAFWEKEEMKIAAERYGTPRITPHAAQMVREGSITDRLYDLSFHLAERKAGLAEHKRAQEESWNFSPRINESSHFMASQQRILPVEDDLLRRDELVKQKHLAKLERLLEIERDLHHPRINPVSEIIASRLPSTTQERLLNPPMRRSMNHDANGGAGGNRDSAYTFKPEINPKSKEIVEERYHQTAADGSVRPPTAADRIDQLYSRDAKRKEHINSLRKHYQEKEMEECTFAPKVSSSRNNNKGNKNKNNSRYSSSKNDNNDYEDNEEDDNGNGNHDDENVVPLFERVSRWQKMREAKIERERQAAAEKELEGCTFRPAIHSSSNGANKALSPTNSNNALQQQQQQRAAFAAYKESNSGTGKCLGFDEWVQKQVAARQMREEKNQGVFITGEGWTGKTTKPKEFKLGKARNKAIKALQKPISPPSHHNHHHHHIAASSNSNNYNDGSNNGSMRRPPSTNVNVNATPMSPPSTLASASASGKKKLFRSPEQQESDDSNSTGNHHHDHNYYNNDHTDNNNNNEEIVVTSQEDDGGHSGEIRNNNNNSSSSSSSMLPQQGTFSKPSIRILNSNFNTSSDMQSSANNDNISTSNGRVYMSASGTPLNLALNLSALSLNGGSSGGGASSPRNSSTASSPSAASSPSEEWIRRSLEKKAHERNQKLSPRPWRDAPVI